MKNKEWLKNKINKVTSRIYGADFNTIKETDELIDQLEEPNEIELSEPSAWKTIAKLYHPNEVYWGNVRDSYLESLEEPEKPLIPQYVADWIEICKERADLVSCLEGSFQYGQGGFKTETIKEYEDWLFEHDHADLVTRAWLDGYTVEKEKLYIIKFAPSIFGTPTYGSIGTQNGKKIMQSVYGSQEGIIIPNQYTRREIEEVGSEYMAFAEEVTE